MRFLFLTSWLIALPLFAATAVDLKNDREGKSFYSKNSDKRAMARALKQIDGSQISGAFNEIARELDENTLCSFDVNFNLQKKLKRINKKFDEMEGTILYLRTQNEFDDSVAKILLAANKTVTTDILLPKENLFYPKNAVVTEALDIIKNFEKKSKNQCFDDAFKNLYGDIIKTDIALDSYNVEALLVEAHKRKLISFDLYLKLEQSRTNELEKLSLNLKQYVKKIKSLRLQFPLRDRAERSDFVTEKLGKNDISRRQRLLDGYTDLQIMIMANVIKKLRSRLESPKVEILIYDRENGVETITLDAMERFRLAVKLLRKEMALLTLNTYFKGRSPDYMDLMTAAYEVGIIPAVELTEVAGLEEIWNPERTFWDKAGVWIRTLSSVATIAIPPPYGFVPALAIVIIEMTAGKKENNNDDPTVLF